MDSWRSADNYIKQRTNLNSEIINQISNFKTKVMSKAGKTSKVKTAEVLVINTSLINKKEVFRMLALAHSTGMPLLLEGPPGVGKTATVVEYAKAWAMDNIDATDKVAMKKAQEAFMDKVFILETDEGTKASEVKGMPDLETLFIDNKYKLSTPITEAEIVIINEVDKASSAIRNSLLGIMNEKCLFNGKHKIQCKWKLFIATCNEIPKEEVGSPFWDRFILKMPVNRVSAGELVKYFELGARDYRESFELGLPSKAEIAGLSIPTTKLEKFLEVGYNDCSDRTLTFVPTLAKAVSFIWNESIDKSLVKVASLMISSNAGSELQNKLMSPEVKNLLTKIDMLYSISDSALVDTHLLEIETLMKGYAAAGKIDDSQLGDIEGAINYVLENHPIKQKEAEIENILEAALKDDTQF